MFSPSVPADLFLQMPIYKVSLKPHVAPSLPPRSTYHWPSVHLNPHVSGRWSVFPRSVQRQEENRDKIVDLHREAHRTMSLSLADKLIAAMFYASPWKVTSPPGLPAGSWTGSPAAAELHAHLSNWLHWCAWFTVGAPAHYSGAENKPF